VTFDDGRWLFARFVGADPIFDLVLLRISASLSDCLAMVALGDFDRVRVGDDVVVIGNLIGLDQTLIRGIVSGMNRVLPETLYSVLESLIQTDAFINPGNSGGPFLNRCGEVIGINTAVIADAQNIGFVVLTNLVKAIMASLLAYGRVIRSWLGFHGQLVISELKELLKALLVDGFFVEVIELGSPVEGVGFLGGWLELEIDGCAYLLGGDVIIGVNGRVLDSLVALVEVMRKLVVGASVRLNVYREG